MTTECPFLIFESWYQQACQNEINDPNAATLSTIDENGHPDARIILVKQMEKTGFTFFSNYNSVKAKQLQARPFANICFHWKSTRRQVRINGTVQKTITTISDEYFLTRSRESRIGAFASKQSSLLKNRDELNERVAHFTEKFAGKEVVRPENWGGFLLMPTRIEFWEDMPHRLHNRQIFDKSHSLNWETALLYP